MTSKPVATITGGGGYVGLRLARKLVKHGYRVQLFDVMQPPNLPELLQLEPNQISTSSTTSSTTSTTSAAVADATVSFIVGDIRQAEDVGKVVRDTTLGKTNAPVDVLFHIASYGMSGAESLAHAYIKEVNVTGTEHVIAACLAAGVPRLVYTSTYNVVFHGQTIVNGDESEPYVDLEMCKDVYSQTKARAEMMVLSADKAALRTSSTTASQSVEGAPGVHDTMRTCAIRPAGIYGPGERRHLPRTIGMVRAGLFQFVFGPADSLVDWLHVENLCEALYLASEGLTAERKFVAGGQAYFISDNQPINNFEFMKPFITGLGYSFPFIRLPYGMMYNIAYLMEMLVPVLACIGIRFVPLLSRAEVNKCSVTHYFSVEKARCQLGYQPVRYPMSETVAWFKENGFAADSKPKGNSGSMAQALVMPMALLVILMIMAVFIWRA